MEIFSGSICTIIILSLVILAVKSQETKVEASFSANPIAVNQDTVFTCKVWNLDPEQQVGINGATSTVFVRDSELLPNAPDKLSLNIYTSLPDGYTQYELTIKGVELDDAGPYSCAVLTVIGQVMAVATDSETLDVLDIYLPPEGFPRCSVVENRLSYYAGEELTLSCYSTDGKPSITLLWTRDNIPLSENQTRIEEGGLIFENMSIALQESDNGVEFKCIIISSEFPSNGRECSIGSIAVWPPKMTTAMSTVLYNSTDELDIRHIGGLTLPVFVMVVVGVGLFGIILIILLAIYCTRAYHCTCILHKRSYSIAQGLTTSDILQEGTVRVDKSVYSPSRPAPITPPAQYTDTIESNSNSTPVQPRYTPKDSSKRLSAVESALLMAVSKSLSRDKPREENGSEVIYANTSRPPSVIEMSILERDEDDVHDVDEDDHGDSDSGFVNPAYAADNDSPTENYTKEVARPSSIAARSRSASQSEIIYHNTAELPIDPYAAEQPTQDSEPPEYAQVDKSRSRTSTMDSVRNIVEPEAVTTLDDNIIYRNTTELGINSSQNIPQSPPPVPVNPPSPVTVKKPPYKRAVSSVSSGGPEKPSFKPPPPPTPVPTLPSSNPIYDDTPVTLSDESKVNVIEKPIVSPKPAGALKPPQIPHKPSYQI